MRPGAKGIFNADAFMLEVCGTALVPTNREADRAHHDPGNFTALWIAKEMHRNACKISACESRHANRRHRRRF